MSMQRTPHTYLLALARVGHHWAVLISTCSGAEPGCRRGGAPWSVVSYALQTLCNPVSVRALTASDALRRYVCREGREPLTVAGQLVVVRAVLFAQSPTAAQPVAKLRVKHEK